MRFRSWMINLTVCAVIGTLIFIAAQNLPAGFNRDLANVSVEIDGVNYGTFQHIDGMETALTGTESSYRKISFQRDFVTDPSLYLWAKNNVSERQGLRDVHIVRRSSDGEEISRYVLKLCQPLTWTVEAANPALGGFHETVELAVQEISVH